MICDLTSQDLMEESCSPTRPNFNQANVFKSLCLWFLHFWQALLLTNSGFSHFQCCSSSSNLSVSLRLNNDPNFFEIDVCKQSAILAHWPRNSLRRKKQYLRSAFSTRLAFCRRYTHRARDVYREWNAMLCTLCFLSFFSCLLSFSIFLYVSLLLFLLSLFYPLSFLLFSVFWSIIKSLSSSLDGWLSSQMACSCVEAL